MRRCCRGSCWTGHSDQPAKTLRTTRLYCLLVVSPAVGPVYHRSELISLGGIGVTPFASILKTLWYRMNDFGKSTQTRLSKVYFVWVIRDFGLAECKPTRPHFTRE